MKKISILTLFILIFASFSFGQDTCDIVTDVISTYPVFPQENGGVTIYFDATKGNQALKDYTGDIYAHTGVVTTESPSGTYWLHVVSDWGENLPKTKFTKIADNLYKLEITNIRDYYGITDPNEHVLKIAMVIRSGTTIPGSSDYYVARNADGSDFFIPLYQDELNVKILNPNPSKFLYEPTGDTVNVCAYAVNATEFDLYFDGQLILSDTTESLHFKILTDSLDRGTHTIVAAATNSTATVYDSASFLILPPVPVADLPEGLHKGVNIINDTTVTFVLWDPAAKKQFVFLLGDFNDWQVNENYLMNRTPDGKYYWLTVSGLNPSEQYAYQYFVDGQIYLADPYTHLILDPWNDPYIPASVFPNLKPYPEAKANGIVSVFQINTPQYPWSDSSFVVPDSTDLVIYELWINDFVQSHSFTELKEKLDYLQSLGINAIELMPVNEFEGNISWGYNPDFYFAVDKYYGTAWDFKDFINECHKRGIAVIMDIVLNHSYGQSPMVRMYWDALNNRPSADNPWFNPTPRHPFSVGYDFNHESPATKEFVKEVLKYWLTEFHIDGYRFDLSKGFTQNYTTDVGAWSAYDQSRIDILTDYYHYLKSVKPQAYMILEHFAWDEEEQVLAKTGMMLWSNSNNAFAQTLMGWTNESDFSRIFYTTHGFDKPAAVSFMESHDEERIMYKALTWGNAYGDYNVKKLETAINREMALVPFFFASPGPKMIWQFGELGYDVSIDNPCRTCPKPIRWNYYDDSLRRQLYQRYAQMIYWKKNDDIFDKAEYRFNLFGNVKYIKALSDDKNIIIVANFGVKPMDYKIDFPHTGLWIDLFADSTFVLDQTEFMKTYQPGEFHFFTDKLVEIQQDTTPAQEQGMLKIYPNPARGFFAVKATPTSVIDIYSHEGRKVYSAVANQDLMTINTVGWTKGIYIVRLRSNDGVKVGKVIVN